MVEGIIQSVLHALKLSKRDIADKKEKAALLKEIHEDLALARKSPKGLDAPVEDGAIALALGLGATYKEMGTTKEEVKDLRKKNEINYVKTILDHARKNPVGMDAAEEDGSLALALDYGATYKEMGTSKEEVQALRKKHDLPEAKKMLEQARKSPAGLEAIDEDGVLALALGTGITYKEMGSSQEEISALRQKNTIYLQHQLKMK